MANYLFKRDSVYYFRCRNFTFCSQKHKTSEIRFSLHTKSLKIAKTKVRLFLAKLEVAKMEKVQLSSNDIKSLVQQYKQEMLDDHEIAREDGYFIPKSLPERNEAIAEMRKAIEDLKLLISLGKYHNFRSDANDLLRQHNIQVNKNSHEYSSLQRKIAIANLDIFKIESERMAGNYDNEWDKRELSQSTITKMPSLEPEVNSGFTLQDVVTKYIDFLRSKKDDSEDYINGIQSFFNIFFEVLAHSSQGNLSKDTNITNFKRYHLDQAVELLPHIPSRMKVIKEYRNKNIPEILKMNIKPDKLISARTFGKFLSHLSTFFGWASKKQYLSSNIAAGIKQENVPRDQQVKESEERSIYSTEDLQRLIDLPMYNQKLEGMLIDKPHLIFIPLIALFTGMRLQEVCQLDTSDIIEQDGIVCFHIQTDSEDSVNSETGKKLKSAAGHRLIPIHSQLIKLGMLHYIEKVRKFGHKKLWFRLKPGKNGRYKFTFGKTFGRLNRQYITQDTKKVFHSFRHTFANVLKQQQVQDTVIAELVGHSLGSITLGRYGKGYNVRILKDAVEQINYDLDLVDLGFRISHFYTS